MRAELTPRWETSPCRAGLLAYCDLVVIPRMGEVNSIPRRLRWVPKSPSHQPSAGWWLV